MILPVSSKVLRKRRVISLTVIIVVAVLAQIVSKSAPSNPTTSLDQNAVLSETTSTEVALGVLDKIEVKGRAPKTGYSRDEFGDGWENVNGCDMRNIMLQRMLEDIVMGSDNCVVLSGKLTDVYTAKQIAFVRGNSTSADVQIDHVVALSDAWQKGAQDLSYERRVELANDPLNLLAVDGKTNQDKGDSDAASWLPPNKEYRCQYVARQIAVKYTYGLWVTDAERSTMKRVLNSCPEQRLPTEVVNETSP